MCNPGADKDKTQTVDNPFKGGFRVPAAHLGQFIELIHCEGTVELFQCCSDGQQIGEPIHAVIANASGFFLVQTLSIANLSKPPVVGREIDAVGTEIVSLPGDYLGETIEARSKQCLDLLKQYRRIVPIKARTVEGRNALDADTAGLAIGGSKYSGKRAGHVPTHAVTINLHIADTDQVARTDDAGAVNKAWHIEYGRVVQNIQRVPLELPGQTIGWRCLTQPPVHHVNDG